MLTIGSSARREPHHARFDSSSRTAQRYFGLRDGWGDESALYPVLMGLAATPTATSIVVWRLGDRRDGEAIP